MTESITVVTPTETIKTQLIHDRNSARPQYRGLVHGELDSLSLDSLYSITLNSRSLFFFLSSLSLSLSHFLSLMIINESDNIDLESGRRQWVVSSKFLMLLLLSRSRHWLIIWFLGRDSNHTTTRSQLCDSVQRLRIDSTAMAVLVLVFGPHRECSEYPPLVSEWSGCRYSGNLTHYAPRCGQDSTPRTGCRSIQRCLGLFCSCGAWRRGTCSLERFVPSEEPRSGTWTMDVGTTPRLSRVMFSSGIVFAVQDAIIQWMDNRWLESERVLFASWIELDETRSQRDVSKKESL